MLIKVNWDNMKYDMMFLTDLVILLTQLQDNDIEKWYNWFSDRIICCISMLISTDNSFLNNRVYDITALILTVADYIEGI